MMYARIRYEIDSHDLPYISGKSILKIMHILDHIMNGNENWNTYGYDGFEEKWKDILEEIYKEAIENKKKNESIHNL